MTGSDDSSHYTATINATSPLKPRHRHGSILNILHRLILTVSTTAYVQQLTSLLFKYFPLIFLSSDTGSVQLPRLHSGIQIFQFFFFNSKYIILRPRDNKYKFICKIHGQIPTSSSNKADAQQILDISSYSAV